MRSEGVGLRFTGLRTHLKASLFKVEFNEGVDEGIESFVNWAVLIDREEVQGTVQLGGLLLGEIGFELKVLFLVSGFVLLSGAGNFRELGRGFPSIELFEVETIGVTALDDFIDEGGHVAKKNEAKTVFLSVIGKEVMFVFVEIIHEAAEVNLIDCDLCIALVSIFGTRFLKLFGK